MLWIKTRFKLLLISLILILFAAAEEASASSCPAIGNINYWGSYSFQKDPKLTWDIWGGILSSGRPGATVVLQKFEQHFTFTLADLNWVKSRFDLATQHKDKYDYGAWLLMEEVYHPSVEAKAAWKAAPLARWEAPCAYKTCGQIEGKATLAGVEIKMLKTWIIEDKKQAWDQAWWNNAKANNAWDDPLVWEWSKYYGYSLLKAWHQHMKNLGKKSAVIGFTPIFNGFTQFESTFFPSPMWNYALANYDAVTSYTYPRDLNEITYAVNMVKSLRQKYNYKGKIIHILTYSTKNYPEWNWNFDQNVARSEFNAVSPYVDVIVVPDYAQNDPAKGLIPYAPLLIQFQNQYTGLCYTGTPLPAHCTNSVQDADETGLNCGGADCPACYVPPTSGPSPSSSLASTPVPTPATPTPSPDATGAPIPSASAAPSAFIAPWKSGKFTNPLSFGSIPDLIGGITGWILGIVASIILLMMIVGGFIYTTSAGDQQRMALAKRIIIAALIGFVVIILSASLINELKKVL